MGFISMASAKVWESKMKFAVLLFAAVVLFAGATPIAPATAAPGERLASQAHKKKPYVLRGTSRLPLKTRRKAYSYKYSDVIESRKFNDPALGPNAQGEPFDNGFFFETPRGPFGGTAPYFH